MRGLVLILLATASEGDDRPLFLRPLAVDWPPHLEKKVDRFEGRHDNCVVIGQRQGPDVARLRQVPAFVTMRPVTSTTTVPRRRRGDRPTK